MKPKFLTQDNKDWLVLVFGLTFMIAAFAVVGTIIVAILDLL